jgi:hypothetical protein
MNRDAILRSAEALLLIVGVNDLPIGARRG